MSSVRPILFGANLIAFGKKDGGVHPIPVGCTLHKLVTKCAGLSVKEEMGDLLAPTQLSYWVRRGAEAAVHAARRLLQKLQQDQVLVKLDFRNAFNSVRRKKMSQAVNDLAPSLLPFAHSSYRSSCSLFVGNRILESLEGVQQGETLWVHFFCLFIHHLTTQLMSAFRMFYLGDGSLGDKYDEVLQDLKFIEHATKQLGLQ